jgi:hypothetical protein
MPNALLPSASNLFIDPLLSEKYQTGQSIPGMSVIAALGLGLLSLFAGLGIKWWRIPFVASTYAIMCFINFGYSSSFSCSQNVRALSTSGSN